MRLFLSIQVEAVSVEPPKELGVFSVKLRGGELSKIEFIFEGRIVGPEALISSVVWQA